MNRRGFIKTIAGLAATAGAFLLGGKAEPKKPFRYADDCTLGTGEWTASWHAGIFATTDGLGNMNLYRQEAGTYTLIDSKACKAGDVVTITQDWNRAELKVVP